MNKAFTKKNQDILLYNNSGLRFRVVNWRSSHDIEVEFEVTKYRTKATRVSIQQGSVVDPFYPSIFGVGYIGAPLKRLNTDEKTRKSHSVWYGVISRCYNPKNKVYSNYGGNGVVVADVWHSYQNFQKWYLDNYPESYGVNYHLDKDLKAERCYSPDSCVFLPPELNISLKDLSGIPYMSDRSINKIIDLAKDNYEFGFISQDVFNLILSKLVNPS